MGPLFTIRMAPVVVVNAGGAPLDTLDPMMDSPEDTVFMNIYQKISLLSRKMAHGVVQTFAETYYIYLKFKC